MRYSDVMSMTNLGGKFRRMTANVVTLFKKLVLWVTEKIHGENFRVGVDEKGRKYIGQRNTVYFERKIKDEGIGYFADSTSEDTSHKPHPKWNSFSSQLKKYIFIIHEYIGAEGVPMVFFGELFGDGFKKGFSFGMTDMHVAFFEVKTESGYMLPNEAFDLFDQLGLPSVPFIDIMTVQEFIDYDIESLESKIAKEKYVEGIVGVPLNGVPEWWDFGDRCIAKNKTEKHAEAQKVKKPKKAKYQSPFSQFSTLVRMEHVVAVLEEKGLEIDSDKKCRQKVITSFVFNIRKEENEGIAFSKEDQKALTTEGHRIFSKYLASSVVL